MLYKDFDIVKNIKIYRLTWIGHVIRRQDGEIIKRIGVMIIRPERKRKMSRSRIIWIDCVEKDWRRMAQNRNDWRKFFE